MSFFSDPELYLVWGRQMGFKFFVFRIKTRPGHPFLPGEFTNHEELSFSKHLSLPHNKESDFNALFAYLSRNDKFVNCQGHVINWYSPGRPNTYAWAPESLNLSSYGVYASSHQQQQGNNADNDSSRLQAERLQALEKLVADLTEKVNQQQQDFERRLLGLHEELYQERVDRETQVLDLTSKLEESRRAGAN